MTMKILYLGQIVPGQTALMRMRALERLGHKVHGVNTVEPSNRASWISRQVQKRVRPRAIAKAMNSKILSAAREFRPTLVWADKQEFLGVETIEALRNMGAILAHFTPDPYFTLIWKRTRIMDEAIRHFDYLIYCKKYEMQHYEALGKPTFYMPLGYCDEVHRPLPNNHAWGCDVGFVGGWEPRRQRMLHSIALENVRLRFRGAYWDFLKDGKWTLRRYLILNDLAAGERVHIHRDELLARAHDGNEVYGDDYARALSGAKIGLGFLRQVCPDQHTTRTFEIPACGSLLLADRTDEHQEFFVEGKEAEFFDSTGELLDKMKFYCSHCSVRTRVAEAGYKRCIDGAYAYVDRLKAVLHSMGMN
jgi:spore maturation protein CgeB